MEQLVKCMQNLLALIGIKLRTNLIIYTFCLYSLHFNIFLCIFFFSSQKQVKSFSGPRFSIKYPVAPQHSTLVHVTAFQNKVLYGKGRKIAPIRTIFNSSRPWANVCRCNKLHLNISKIAIYRLITRKQKDRETDKRPDKRRSTQKVMTSLGFVAHICANLIYLCTENNRQLLRFGIPFPSNQVDAIANYVHLLGLKYRCDVNYEFRYEIINLVTVFSVISQHFVKRAFSF